MSTDYGMKPVVYFNGKVPENVNGEAKKSILLYLST
jgi:hypothetical protein